jgi:hypothetical protein
MEDAYVWMDRSIRNLKPHSYNPNALLVWIDNFANGRLLKRWLASIEKTAKIKSSSSGFVFTRQHGGLAQNAKSNKTNDLERLISKLQLEGFASRSSLFKGISGCNYTDQNFSIRK